MIRLKALGAGYKGCEVIRDITLDIPDSSLTCLIGTNGSGKTTLLKTIARILPAVHGSIQIDGRVVKEFSKKEYARILSYLPQLRSTPQLSVGKLIEHGRFPHLGYMRILGEADKSAVQEAVRLAALKGLEHRELKELSGGQRQRAYIGMLLAQNAKYMLLDEPVNFLDAGSRFELMELMRALTKMGKTILLSIHDLPLALEYSDKIILTGSGTARIFDKQELLSSSVIREHFGVDAVKTIEGDIVIRRAVMAEKENKKE